MVYAKNPQSLSPWEGRGAGLGEAKKDKMCQLKTRGREKEGVVQHAVKRSSNAKDCAVFRFGFDGSIDEAPEQ